MDAQTHAPRTGRVPAANAQLFARAAGQGQPLVVLHGGPDFNHGYLLPDLDRLGDAYRLLYYDQRGRGQSVGEWETVCLESEVADLDAVLDYFGLEAAALLGHSWGGVLALAYALRRPARVSHLILMNTAPASFADMQQLRETMARRMAPHAAALNALRNTEKFAAGDPATVAEFYRVRFQAFTRRPERLDGLDFGYSRCSQADVQRARAVEARLYGETYYTETFDLLPALQQLRMPTLVVHGADDLIPVEVAAHIAQAIPRSRLVVLPDCGHFAYMECPEAVRAALDEFFGR